MLTTRTLQVRCIALLVASARIAFGQCTFEWNPGQPLAGVNGDVYASVVHHDGTGPKLYIGGFFSFAMDTQALSVAAFDGTNWSPVGDAAGGHVYALASYNGDLYAGGLLYDGTNAFVMRWDGQAWSTVAGGPSNIVFALTVHDGALFAGGFFWDLYRWDGANWTVIPGLDGSPIYALRSYGGQLIATGDIRIEGSGDDEHIAAWDAAGWHPLGGGLDGHADALHVHLGELFVGGHFRRAGNLDVTGVARWNGQTWLPLGNALNVTSYSSLNAFATFDNDVYVTGFFRMPGEPDPYHLVARWDGVDWTGIAGSPLNFAGLTLMAFNGHLYAGGHFRQLGTLVARNLGVWDGSAWDRISPGVVSGARDAVIFGGQLFVGNLIAAIDDVEMHGIARFDGENWHDASEGVGTFISCLAVIGDRLIAAWSDGPGASSYRLCAWNGTAWDPLPGLFDRSINALALYGGQLVAGGWFDNVDGQPRTRIAYFDGSAWQPLGTGVGVAGDLAQSVRALAEFQGALAVGGTFSQAGGNPSASFAQWSGSAWSELGGGIAGASPSVNALVVRDGWLHVAGSFTSAGPISANNIARWNGQTWQTYGAGTSGRLQTVEFVGQSMYVGGAFSSAGGEPAVGVARWDGAAWHAVDGGLTNGIGGVSGIAQFGNRLYFVGDFHRAGGDMSVAFASLDLPALAADLDHDGDCDLQDLATLLSGFGTEDGPGDLDADGDTDLEDLALLLADFAAICP